MPRKKKKGNSYPDDPRPLNFDHAAETGPSDRLDKPFMTPEDARGDDQNDQYYDEEEYISPEEAKKRKEEGNL